LQFGIEPGPASGDFGSIWFFVDVLVTFGFPLKVFDHIRHVDFLAVYASRDETFVQNLSGWTNKGLALDVFVEPRLLSYEHHLCLRGAFAKHRLRRPSPKRASSAGFGSCHHFRIAGPLRHEWCGGRHGRTTDAPLGRKRFGNLPFHGISYPMVTYDPSLRANHKPGEAPIGKLC
jgi:hypothetical protein